MRATLCFDSSAPIVSIQYRAGVTQWSHFPPFSACNLLKSLRRYINWFQMWRTALLRSRRRVVLFRPSQPFRCLSSTTRTAPDFSKTMKATPSMPWERVLEGGKEYGTFMASVLTFFILFGGTVQTVRRLASPWLVFWLSVTV